MAKHTPEMNNSDNFKQSEALHLADYLEFSHRHADGSPEFIAAAELRRLYAEVDRLSYQLAYPDNFVKEPEQEPVGSLSVRYHRGCKSMTNTDFDYNGDLPEGDYELYTSPPAQRKPLTDEEIDRLWSQSLADTEGETWLPLREFARAIEAAHGIKGDA